MNVIITIDGPASSGKSTVGYLLSKRLGFHFVDSGSIYRAGCYKIISDNINLNDLTQIKNVYDNLQIDFVDNSEGQVIILDGIDITNYLHSREVTKLVSVVGAISEVRISVRRLQQTYSEQFDTVFVGRDLGSEVFPNAKMKFYLTASTDVRAKRRFDALIKSKVSICYQEVYDGIISRDLQDSSRRFSPMCVPKESLILDSSNKGIDEIVIEMENSYSQHVLREGTILNV